MGSIPGRGWEARSRRVGNGTPLQYSCLENSMSRGAWWAIAHGAVKSDTTEHTQSDQYENSLVLAIKMVLTSEAAFVKVYLFRPPQ